MDAAPTGPLAWEPPPAVRVALEKAKRQKRKKKKRLMLKFISKGNALFLRTQISKYYTNKNAYVGKIYHNLHINVNMI